MPSSFLHRLLSKVETAIKQRTSEPTEGFRAANRSCDLENKLIGALRVGNEVQEVQILNQIIDFDDIDRLSSAVTFLPLLSLANVHRGRIVYAVLTRQPA